MAGNSPVAGKFPDLRRHPAGILPGPRALVPKRRDEPLPEARRHPPAELAAAIDALPRAVVREREAGGAAAPAHALLRFQDPALRSFLDELRLESARDLRRV